MPELPDVTVYVEALTARLAGHPLTDLVVLSPFVLRSVEPPVAELRGRTIADVRRIGKRMVFRLDADLFVVVHLMIAGRLRWREPGQKPGVSSKMLLARFEFAHGTLLLTEASSQKRASLHIVRGEASLAAFDRGGVDPLTVSTDACAEVLTRENHTLKRTLTDPRLFSGIGNAYSDEILHAARLSPLKLSRSLSAAEIARLCDAMRATLSAWTERLRAEAKGGVPETVTAFHPEMAVHGRFRQPCPVCGSPVQRIVYAANECNYCARCQTGGRLLADRSLSRLLKDDWPRSIDDL